jgi:hypothetical protein
MQGMATSEIRGKEPVTNGGRVENKIGINVIVIRLLPAGSEQGMRAVHLFAHGLIQYIACSNMYMLVPGGGG